MGSIYEELHHLVAQLTEEQADLIRQLLLMIVGTPPNDELALTEKEAQEANALLQEMKQGQFDTLEAFSKLIESDE